MTQPNHPTLQRLISLWELETQESGWAGLGSLSARDLRYFHFVFKDSLVGRGPDEGPFRLSFVGTDLEAQIGRKMINVEIGDCFGSHKAEQLSKALIEAVKTHRPVLAEVRLSSPKRQDQLEGELLCLPFVESSLPGDEGASLSATIFGTLALADRSELLPEPTHREMNILDVSTI